MAADAATLQRLFVVLDARMDRYERELRKARGLTSRQFGAMRKQVLGFESTIAGMGRGIGTAFASVAAIRGASKLIDTATRIENSLKVAGLAGEDLTRVYNGLRDAALKNAAPFEALTTLYGRAALVQKELGVSTDDLIGFSNNVALALRVSGQSATESSGALLQLSQALGSGVVRAEEFNSILEGAPTILQAAAAGIKEADGSVAKLRAIMLAGNLSSKALFDGFQAGAVILEDKVAGSSLTVSQAFENLNTRMIDVARRFNENTDASRFLVDGITNLGDGIEDLAVFLNNVIGPLQTFIGGLNDGIGSARGLANEIARITGADKGIGFDFAVATNNLTGGAGLSVGSSAAGRVLSQSFELLASTPSDEKLAAILAGEIPPDPLQVVVEGANPISINDPAYKPPAGTGTGSGTSPGQKYADSLANFQQKVDALNAETALLRTLNPLRNDYGYASEKLKAQLDLENAARKAGIDLGPQQRQQIQQLAEAYATATAESGRLAEAQNMQVEQFGEIRDAARSALETIIDGFVEGKDAGEIFADVLGNIGKQMLNMGLNALFGGGGAGGGFGLFGQIFGFASGGEVHGAGSGTSDSIPAMLSNGEFVVNARATRKHGRLLQAINGGFDPRFEGRIVHLAKGGMVPGGGQVGRGQQLELAIAA